MTFTITPRGAFSLRESALFGFGQRHSTPFEGTMRLAFCLDGTWEPVAVSLTQQPDGTVVGEGPAHAAAQVARVLSLDLDGTGFAAIEDPVIQRLQQVAPGLRPPLFHSAYEALSWCVLSARRPVRQMQAVRSRLSEAAGTTFDVAGEQLACFPTPEALLRQTEIPGLDDVKVSRLHAIARAALDGDLDTEALRRLDASQARARVERLPGVGPFTSQLVTVRTLGHADLLPDSEPRAEALIGELYGLGRPATPAEVQEIARAWSPFRTWALVLIRAASKRLEGATV